ncbi:hypothetical protein IFM89_027137 [Coptis chinensis]|uniref:Uncharacterized protein n=1 Tax=Coptis chinensis TaxID=261450 RepID=A0A835IVB9_9MAGN|nr:hypothetical protein IFM89_027137 [Coptis chinensis]
MAGLLAWAADVVGGNHSNEEDENTQFPTVIFTPEQQTYARELEQKANHLRRSIQDLRLRIPPPDISQRLPHLHAHSLASNAALALQLNAHSTTREQEMDLTERDLKSELEMLQATLEGNRVGKSLGHPETTGEAETDTASNSIMLEKLDAKRKDLNSMEGVVQHLEKRWALVQQNSLRQPSPAQREKILDKQLHSLIEQLAAKQAQAENLASEVHVKTKELERLNGLRRGIENGNADINSARYRFGSSSGRISSVDLNDDSHLRPYLGGRTESQKRFMILRSSFVLYILVLHILVFIKISF